MSLDAGPAARSVLQSDTVTGLDRTRPQAHRVSSPSGTAGGAGQHIPAGLVHVLLQSCLHLIVGQEGHVAWVSHGQKVPVPQDGPPGLREQECGKGRLRGGGGMPFGTLQGRRYDYHNCLSARLQTSSGTPGSFTAGRSMPVGEGMREHIAQE